LLIGDVLVVSEYYFAYDYRVEAAASSNYLLPSLSR